MRAAVRLLALRPGELRPVLLSGGLFCALLASYYLLRPLRDELAVQGGVGRLPWTFTATFLVMLAAVPIYGWACSRIALARLLPGVYLFFAGSLLLFQALLADRAIAPQAGVAFFVWVSVFNLFVVSVFWSLMAELHDVAAAKRLFGLIAAGGSIGAIGGPLLAVGLVRLHGAGALLPFSAALLLLAAALAHALRREAGLGVKHDALGGSALAGLRAALGKPYLLAICLWLLLYSGLSTLLYFAQTEIVGRALAEPAARTQLFATMDLAVNALTLVGQLLLAGRLMSRLGSGAVLALLPLVSLAGFAVLLVAPTLAAIVAIQVLRRAANFAFSRPARETLFTVVPTEDRYKAKNFIDTVVYRGGDAASGWLHAGLAALGLGLAGISACALPLAAGWLVLSLALGRSQQRLAGTRKAR